jgi:hypothetical protein
MVETFPTSKGNTMAQADKHDDRDRAVGGQRSDAGSNYGDYHPTHASQSQQQGGGFDVLGHQQAREDRREQMGSSGAGTDGPWQNAQFTPHRTSERPPVQQQAYQPGQIYSGERQDPPRGHGLGSGVRHRFGEQGPDFDPDLPPAGFESSHYYGNQQPQNRQAAQGNLSAPSPAVQPGRDNDATTGSTQPSPPSTAGRTSK